MSCGGSKGFEEVFMKAVKVLKKFTHIHLLRVEETVAVLSRVREEMLP